MLDSSAYDDLIKALTKLFGEEADEEGDSEGKKPGKTITIMSISKPKKGELPAIPKQRKQAEEDE
jgi:hypothetical protein